MYDGYHLVILINVSMSLLILTKTISLQNKILPFAVLRLFCLVSGHRAPNDECCRRRRQRKRVANAAEQVAEQHGTMGQTERGRHLFSDYKDYAVPGFQFVFVPVVFRRIRSHFRYGWLSPKLFRFLLKYNANDRVLMGNCAVL